MNIKNIIFKNTSRTIKVFLCTLIFAFIVVLNTTNYGTSVQHSIFKKIHSVAVSNNLILTNVYIKGRINTPKQEVLDTIVAKTGGSIFHVNLTNIHKKITTIGWVKNATVERRFPNTLFITVQEHKPIAIWQLNGKLRIINKDGVVLSDKQLQKFSHLKILVGKTANKHVVDFIRLISYDTSLAKLVTAGVLVSNRRWNIILLNRIEIKLPQENANKSWKRLAKYAKEKDLLARDIKSIDMRVPNKIFLQMNPTKKRKDSKT